MSIIVTPEALARTVVAGMSHADAARLLGVNRSTVWRAAKAHGVPLPPRWRTIETAADWRRLYQQHGQSVHRLSEWLGMRRPYVTEQLERHGIRPTPDAWADRQEA